MLLLRKLFWIILFFITGKRKLYNAVIKGPLQNPNHSKLTIPKIERFVQQVLLSNQYYRKRYSKLTNNLKFKNIPIMEKKELKKSSISILNKEYIRSLCKLQSTNSVLRNLFFTRNFIFPMSTGGTSGSPLTVYRNREGLCIDALLFLRGWKMMDYKLGDKVLIFYPEYYDYNLSWINRFSFLSGIKLFFFNSLSKETIKQFVRRINSFKPNFIITFPSYLNDATMTIKKENLTLKHIPKGIEVSGETFLEHQRENWKKVFRTKIYDGYGSLETGMIAHECEFCNGMHIYEDIVYPENLNSNLIFTRINLTEMPIIRYKIGDLGKIVYEKCRCGISGLKLKEVEGRVDDYILLPNNKRIYPTSFRQILNKCNQEFSNTILESNIIQNSKNKITLNVILSNNQYKKEVYNYLSKNFRKILQDKIKLNIRFPNKIKRKLKFRFIERNI